MSVRFRWMLTGVSAALWVAWLPLAWMEADTGHSSTTIEIVAELALRVLGVVLTLSTVLGWSISPFIATARVYMRIGELEERERQQAMECGCKERRAVGATVIPIRPVRQHTFSDS